MRFRRHDSSDFMISSASLDALFRSHAARLTVFIARRTIDAGVAADLTAETFAQAFTHRHQFRGRTQEEAVGWLYGIARHQISHYVRRGHAEARALRRLGLEAPSLTDAEIERIEELSGLAEIRGRVASHLDELSLEQREAVRLRILEERTYEEMAEQLGINEQAVRARVSRGMRALAERLKDELDDIEELL
jgi:RNA polymerase sigma factor (sigma-70 family)